LSDCKPRCRFCGAEEGFLLKCKFRDVFICEDCVTAIETTLKWILNSILEDLTCKIKPKEKLNKINKELIITEIQT